MRDPIEFEMRPAELPVDDASRECARLIDLDRGTRPERVASSTTLAGAGAVLMSVQACGGGDSGADSGADSGSDSGSDSGAVQPDAAAKVLKTNDPSEASRFLIQAGFAASDAGIASVLADGFDGWLAAQFGAARTESRWDWLGRKGFLTEAKRLAGTGPMSAPLWRKLIASPDVLRQRVALALSEILVVGVDGVGGSWRAARTAAYMDVLEAHAFSTLRELLEAVTLNSAMGQYLNMRGNRKEDPASGRRPDENYAREVMQLFTIGLVELNPDGSQRLDSSGRPIETYGSGDVTELARVFTGWDLDGNLNLDPEAARRPMTLRASLHSSGAKTFLGKSVQDVDGNRELRLALDVLATHPNNGPFIGRQLIQRLVTSNPTPAYIGRVSAAFADNGAGVRGDLKAVIRAVLLDPEARKVGTTPQAGRLSEPMVRFIQWARTFNASSAADDWAIGDTSSTVSSLGQAPLRSASVFNFYRPGYVPPNTLMSTKGLTAPEFQIANESSVVAYANFIASVVDRGVGGSAAAPSVAVDYTKEIAIADDPQALIARLNRLLCADQLQSKTIAKIRDAVASMPATTTVQRRQRVSAAVLLIMVSPDYLVMK